MPKMTLLAPWREPGRAAPPWYVDAVGLWCLLGYAALAVLARQSGDEPLPAFFLLLAWTGLPVFALILYFRLLEIPLPF
ncbi:MAG: hypothetical protein F4057_01860, partial [Acidobacteria bacterium]|nr:hypothetical protein [Acidobacteriota bacterium]